MRKKSDDLKLPAHLRNTYVHNWASSRWSDFRLKLISFGGKLGHLMHRPISSSLLTIGTHHCCNIFHHYFPLLARFSGNGNIELIHILQSKHDFNLSPALTFTAHHEPPPILNHVDEQVWLWSQGPRLDAIVIFHPSGLK